MSDHKPIVLYVDDEPRNLSLFEVLLGDEFTLKLFDSAVDALKELKEIRPWVIVTDQRMPGMTGLEFLEISAQLSPESPRIIITGQTDEDTMLKLVRRTKLFDYITKPIMEDDLVTSIKKAVEFSNQQRAIAKMIAEKDLLNQQLLEKTQHLEKQFAELEAARKKEFELRKELEAWASIEIVQAIQEQKLTFPMRRDLVCITYDIVQSSLLHGKVLQGHDLRGHVLNLFTAALLRFGGIQENHGGDAAFGHFGAFSRIENPALQALATAQEFRMALRNMTRIHGTAVECGIAIHFAPQSIVNVHEVRAETLSGSVVKKFLSSAAPEIDQLFRLEKLLHTLPGTNIILSEAIKKTVPDKKIVFLGTPQNSPAVKSVNTYLIPSDLITPEQLKEFQEKTFLTSEDLPKKVA